MTTPTVEGCICHYEVEGLVRIDELSDGGFVLARSSLVGTDDAAYIEATQRVPAGYRLIHVTRIPHDLVEKTPFVGPASVVELYA